MADAATVFEGSPSDGRSGEDDATIGYEDAMEVELEQRARINVLVFTAGPASSCRCRSLAVVVHMSGRRLHIHRTAVSTPIAGGRTKGVERPVASPSGRMRRERCRRDP